MSCKLPHKNSIDNLKADIAKLGLTKHDLGITITTKAFLAHNKLVEQDVAKVMPIIDAWNKMAATVGINGSVVRRVTRIYAGDVDSKIGFPRNIFDIEYDEETLNKIDNLRKKLGLYDTQESLSEYLYNNYNDFEQKKAMGYYHDFDEALMAQEEIDNIDETPFESEYYYQLNKPGIDQALEELDTHLLNFLKQFNVQTKEWDTLKDKLGVDALGATDIINKLIWYVKDRNAETVPEEVGHMAVMLMGENHPDIKALLANITKWDEYAAIEAEYLPIYGDFKKIQIEAIGKLIAKSLVKNYEANGLDKTLLQNVLDSLFSFFEKALGFFNIHNSSEKLGDKIAINLLMGNTNYINSLSPKHAALNYEEAIAGNELAQMIITEYGEKLGNKLTGSLAISGQGENIYRPSDDPIHDLDFVVDGVDNFREVVKKIYEHGGEPIHYGWGKGSYTTYSYIIPKTGFSIVPKKRKNGWLKTYDVLDSYGNVVPSTSQNNMNVDFFVYRESSEKNSIGMFASAEDIYKGKLALSPLAERESLFQRQKDTDDYNLRQPLSDEFTMNPQFIYYQLPKQDLDKLKPISEKFDKDLSEFIQYSLKRRNPKYKAETDASKFANNYIFELGRASSILQFIGAPNLPIKLESNWFTDHIIENTKHEVKLSNFRGLVEAIHDPLAIFFNKDGNENKKYMATTLKNADGKNISVVIEFKVQDGALFFSRITTAFAPRDINNFADHVNNGGALYIDKQRIEDYLKFMLGVNKIVYPPSLEKAHSKIEKMLVRVRDFPDYLPKILKQEQRAIATGNERLLRPEPEPVQKGIINKKLNINLSKTGQKIIEELNEKGNRSLIIGGAVRDAILGYDPKDIDIEVYNINYEDLEKYLSRYGKTNLVGKSFGVIKFTDEEGNEYDFSVPRRDSKAGKAHNEIKADVDITMTPKDAAERRDFTWNGLGYDYRNEQIHDYYGGVEDLENKILRATSPKFEEDALRILRAMQFQSRMGLNIDPETMAMMRRMVLAGDLSHMATERVSEEWTKWAEKGKNPSLIFNFLRGAGIELPYILGLQGVPQDPEWHPEGDVEVHTGHVMNAAVKIADREGLKGDDRAVLIFAALTHDFAKPATTQTELKNGVERITSRGHEEAGAPMAKEFLEAIGIKKSIIDRVVPLVANHLQHVNISHIPNERGRIKAANKIAKRLQPSNINELLLLIEADASGRPPLPQGLPSSGEILKDAASKGGVREKVNPDLLTGKHLLAIGYKQGPEMGIILKAAREAQDNLVFSTSEQAIEWVKQTGGVYIPVIDENMDDIDLENPIVEEVQSQVEQKNQFRELTAEQEANPFAVFVLVKQSDGTYSATTRAADTGEANRIGLPGGKVDIGENPRTAAIREAREEGWEVSGLVDIVASRMVDENPVVWYSAETANKLTDYKEKDRGIVPIAVDVNTISNSGYGNDFIQKLQSFLPNKISPPGLPDIDISCK